jgi:hypothetical protein
MCVPEAYCANLPVKLVAYCKHSSGADAVTAHRSCLALQNFLVEVARLGWIAAVLIYKAHVCMAKAMPAP